MGHVSQSLCLSKITYKTNLIAQYPWRAINCVVNCAIGFLIGVRLSVTLSNACIVLWRLVEDLDCL